MGIVKDTEPLSLQIEQALHGVMNDLLHAVRLGPRDEMADRLHRVRKANALRIAQAGKHAATLAAREGEQVGAPDAEATPATSSVKLQHRIERVAAAWATL